MHPVTLSDADLIRQCELQHTRRSGPGGQHRNKVETAVVLTHTPTGVRAEASERRSQAANRKTALFRLRLLLALQHRSPSLPEVPSERWRSRCAAGQVSINPGHSDYPVLLAEVLDRLEADEADIKTVSLHFTCSPSQLVKFLKLEPRAFQWLNDQRERYGLGRLK